MRWILALLTWICAAAAGAASHTYPVDRTPSDPETLAAATARGLYLSRDAGERFRRLDRGAVTAVTFDLEGKRLSYTRAIRRELISAPLDSRDRILIRLPRLDSRARTVIRLPPLGLDYVTHVAQNPKDECSLAIATNRRHVYITNDGEANWLQIAKYGDLP